MSRGRSVLIFGLLSGGLFFAGVGFFLKSYFETRALIDLNQKILLQTEYEIRNYCQLGFSQESKLVQLLQERKSHASEFLDALNKKSSLGLIRDQDKSFSELQLIAVNKKMLSSYICDLKDYRKLGLLPENTIRRFTYDKVIRLTIALAEFERRLKANNKTDKTDYVQKLARMLRITYQSITYHKRALHNCCEQGLSKDDFQVHQIKKRLTRNIKIRNDIERIVYG